ncbi:MAG TPA: tRNA (adenosine(37)-N6)-dimethylallyltransferase MiaA [Candidatus Saccharimonadia bacterium]|nr:tRNA (adenosine(37)-N6)-dimethylallyltransferase MiaA [Candidatus Saccharimonadia bacterium]
MIDDRSAAIFLMGPTASGKTALALSWAQRYGLKLVSVDSALVYRGLDIGAAKPDAATLARFPHRLVDICEPEAPYSAGMFRADALRAIAEISAAGDVPLLVGGTGLYFRALAQGLSTLPVADRSVRAALEAEAAELGWPVLHARLARVDPASAARIHPNDPQRIQRALEVVAVTGRSLSGQHATPLARPPCRVLKLALLPVDRARLHERIADRFRAMVDQGLVEEVRALRERAGLTADHPAMRAVGYRQAWQHLDGEFDRDELVSRGIHATRQLAKRQLTWLRSEYDAIGFDPDDATRHGRIEQLLAGFIRR